MFLKNIKELNRNNGYTLVELLVSIAIFSVVITVAVSGLTRALKTHRQSSATISANNNTAVILEQIIREVRTGSNVATNNGASCPAPAFLPCELIFSNAKNQAIVYRQVGNSIEKIIDLNPPSKITDNDVSVGNVIFQQINFGSYPDRIRISISINPTESGVDQSPINLQSTVSLRNF